MSASPFSFGRTVSTEFFTNRTDEIKRLTANFTTGINTTIISPRRWGKSSLVKKVAAQCAGSKLRVATIDLFSLRTEEEFYNALAGAVLKATSTKATEWMALLGKFIKRVTPKFTMNVGNGQSLGLTLDLDAAAKHYRELLDLPQKIAEHRKIRMVVCIDEFQNIGAFANPLQIQKRLRSIWQHHDRVTYCLYGSKQHMMTELFTRQSSPFYRFGEIMMLQKISEDKWIPYIQRQFRKKDRKISETHARSIVKAVGCHPFYVQQLSHIVWQNTATEVTDVIVDQSVSEMIAQNAMLYYREAEDLNNTELRLLRAIAAGETALSSAAVIATYRLGTSAGVVKARRTLVRKEIIDEEDGKPQFLDPVFALWFNRNMA